MAEDNRSDRVFVTFLVLAFNSMASLAFALFPPGTRLPHPDTPARAEHQVRVNT